MLNHNTGREIYKESASAFVPECKVQTYGLLYSHMLPSVRSKYKSTCLKDFNAFCHNNHEQRMQDHRWKQLFR
jgi:hypothetical protein